MLHLHCLGQVLCSARVTIVLPETVGLAVTVGQAVDYVAMFAQDMVTAFERDPQKGSESTELHHGRN